jgi:hypothetical protein
MVWVSDYVDKTDQPRPLKIGFVTGPHIYTLFQLIEVEIPIFGGVGDFWYMHGVGIRLCGQNRPTETSKNRFCDWPTHLYTIPVD